MIAYFYSIPTRSRDLTGGYGTFVGETKSYSPYDTTQAYPQNGVILFDMTTTELRVRDAVCVHDRSIHTTEDPNYHYTFYYHPFSYEVIEFY